MSAWFRLAVLLGVVGLANGCALALVYRGFDPASRKIEGGRADGEAWRLEYGAAGSSPGRALLVQHGVVFDPETRRELGREVGPSIPPDVPHDADDAVRLALDLGEWRLLDPPEKPRRLYVVEHSQGLGSRTRVLVEEPTGWTWHETASLEDRGPAPGRTALLVAAFSPLFVIAFGVDLALLPLELPILLASPGILIFLSGAQP